MLTPHSHMQIPWLLSGLSVNTSMILPDSEFFGQIQSLTADSTAALFNSLLLDSLTDFIGPIRTSYRFTDCELLLFFQDDSFKTGTKLFGCSLTYC